MTKENAIKFLNKLYPNASHQKKTYDATSCRQQSSVIIQSTASQGIAFLLNLSPVFMDGATKDMIV